MIEKSIKNQLEGLFSDIVAEPKVTLENEVPPEEAALDQPSDSCSRWQRAERRLQ